MILLGFLLSGKCGIFVGGGENNFRFLVFFFKNWELSEEFYIRFKRSVLWKAGLILCLHVESC